MSKVIFGPSIETYIRKDYYQQIVHRIRYINGDGSKVFYIERQDGSIEAKEV